MALLSSGKLGLALAATGVAHFVAPAAFRDLTKQAFPQDTDAWIQRNGGCETVIGLALMAKPTRALGRLGLAGYVGWVAYNGYNAQTSGAH